MPAGRVDSPLPPLRGGDAKRQSAGGLWQGFRMAPPPLNVCRPYGTLRSPVGATED